MFEENSVVRAKQNLSGNVPRGTRGTIVMVYDENIGDYGFWMKKEIIWIY